VWIEAIGELSPESKFGPPASADALANCERVLGRGLPSQLRELLAETNGITGEYDDLLWPLERIQAENLDLRTNEQFAELYMPFDPLLFFAGAGNGDLLALVLRDQRLDVFVWDHETDSRSWVAPDLLTYFSRWLDGTIQL
jgi:hypothetical protein